ncbi:MAG: molybdopterin dinucleotide binding domain-containing protein [Candidatus Bathyarchaeia archaeon]
MLESGRSIMDFTLITGRTIDQGCTKEHAKLSDEYLLNVAVCEMNPEDMKRLNVRDGDNVKIMTDVGSVIVKAKKSRRIRRPGIIFVPFGPWINAILPSETEGTGMPPLKGFRVRVEPTNEPVSDIRSLLLKNYGVKG